ncbi:50S ribosomal protein L3 N(5)-glutamine methyltransferase [Brackiella oedipodis]|uniref:50S ribosomal protein L3 N(5)-glutamine methyltransferase n=1 Tax=Brackiella oedipodis TaxID=124225 RepID=UPI00048D32B1|nr:50S ribosomal protein L3 N(5)-glutamine methyltransferase [Brackiella oedipodis]
MNQCQDLHTVNDWIRYAYSRFNQAQLSFGHGNSNAWDEAVNLVLNRLSLPLDQLQPFLNCRLVQEEKMQVLGLIEKRIATRQPLPYLTGEAWLQGYRFITSNDVIVPRSPIAELLVEKLQPWVADPYSDMRILDMCTGSACLAIIAAMEFPNAQVDAVDINEAAIALAQQNIAEYELQDDITLIQSDLFEQLANKVYDIIICNPPYVNAQSMQNLPPEYQHEPALALHGGTKGMDLVQKILQQAPKHLTDDGFLVLEIGHEIDFFTEVFPQLQPIWLETANSDDQIMLLQRSHLLEAFA